MSKQVRTRKMMLLAAVGVVSSFVLPPAMAANKYWDVNGTDPGLGGSGTWNTVAGNNVWNTNTSGEGSGTAGVWVNTDAAFFSGTPGTVSVAEAITANGITFNGGTELTAGGGSLTLGGNVAYNAVTGGTMASIAAPLSLGTVVRTFTIADDASLDTELQISGNIAATTGGLTKAGAGVLSLTGTLGYTGVTTISAGTLVVGDGTHGINSIDNASHIVIGTAALAGNGTFTRTLNTVAGTSTISLAAGGGFAAVGGALTVNLNNASGSTLVWSTAATGGTNGFVTGQNWYVGSTIADNVTTFNHALNLNSQTYRDIYVADNPNSSADKFVITGAITNGSNLRIFGKGVLEFQGGGSCVNLPVGLAGTVILSNNAWNVSTTLSTTGSGSNLKVSNAAVNTNSLTLNAGSVNIDPGAHVTVNGNVTLYPGTKVSVDGSTGTTELLKTGGNIVMANAAATADALTGSPAADGFGSTLNPAPSYLFEVVGNGSVVTTPHVHIGGVKTGTLDVYHGGIVHVSGGAFVQNGARSSNARDANGNPLGTPTSSGGGMFIAHGGQANTYSAALVVEGANTWYDNIGGLNIGWGAANGVKPGVLRVLDGARFDQTGPTLIARGDNSTGSILVQNATFTTQGQPSGSANFVNPSGGTVPGSYMVVGGFNGQANQNAQVIIDGASGVWDSYLTGEGGKGWSYGAVEMGASIAIGETLSWGADIGSATGVIRASNGATINTNHVANFLTVGNSNNAGYSGTIEVKSDATWNHLGGATMTNSFVTGPAASGKGTIIVGPHGRMTINSGGRFLVSGTDAENFVVSSGTTGGGIVSVDGASATHRSTLQTPAIFLENGFRAENANGAFTAGTSPVQLNVTNGALVDLTSTTTDSVISSRGVVTLGAGGEIRMNSSRTLQLAGMLQGSGVVTGNVNATGIVSPGNSPGTLSISGDYTGSGTLLLEVDATAMVADRLDITGTANISGVIDIIRLDSGPANGVYDLIRAEVLSIDSATLIAAQADVAAAFSGSGVTPSLVLLHDAIGTIDVLQVTVPEPGSMLLIGSAAGLLLMRRRCRGANRAA